MDTCVTVARLAAPIRAVWTSSSSCGVDVWRLCLTPCSVCVTTVARLAAPLRMFWTSWSSSTTTSRLDKCCAAVAILTSCWMSLRDRLAAFLWQATFVVHNFANRGQQIFLHAGHLSHFHCTLHKAPHGPWHF